MSLTIPAVPKDLRRPVRALTCCADYLGRLLASVCHGASVTEVLEQPGQRQALHAAIHALRAWKQHWRQARRPGPR
jgi:hypothetical protein